jgi:hypothetical protein
VSLNFMVGKPPENLIFRADPHWSAIPGYDDSMPMTLRAVAMGATPALLLGLVWYFMAPGGLPISLNIELSSVLIAFALATIVHELCHLLLFPRMGLQHTTVGIWPQMGAVFVQFRKPVSRARFIAITLAPLLLISLLPIALAFAGFAIPTVVRWGGVINALAAGADMLAVLVLLKHSSASAQIVESGHTLLHHSPN